MSRAILLATTLIVSTVLAPVARADVTADQATAVEAQLKAWATSVFGGNANFAAAPLHVVPDGDRYRIQFPVELIKPLAGAGKDIVTISGPPFTALTHPLDANRWAIDGWSMPSPLKFSITSPDPKKNRTFSLAIESQTASGVFDTSLATASTIDGKQTGISESFDTPEGPATATVARANWHNVMSAQSANGVGVDADAVLEGYATTVPGKPGQSVTFAIDKVTATSKIVGLDLADLGKIIRLISSPAAQAVTPPAKPSVTTPGGRPAPGRATPAKPPAPPMSADQRAMAHELVSSMAGLLTSFDGAQTLDHLNVQAAGHTVQIGQLGIAAGIGAPGGKADLHMRMAMDDLDSSEIPAGPFRAFIPKHVVLAPRLSGVPKAELVGLIDQAIDDQGRDATAALMPAVMKMMGDGPIAIGIDELMLDIGTSKLTGVGKVEIASPGDISGHAEIHLTGLDALMRQVNTTPQTKQAAPVLIFLKGIGEQNGEDTVWVVNYEDNKLTVNGTDMSGMMPGNK
jgi:hypothetical protein